MAEVNSDAYIVPTRGFVYLAPVGTEAPSLADLAAPPEPWQILGHVGTADGDGLPVFPSDGGDVTTLGSWNQQAVRTTTEPLTETVEFSASQIDAESLRLYTGADGGSAANRFEVFGHEVNSGTQTALLIVIQDGNTRIGWWAPKVEVRRGDDIELDPEGPILLPLSCTLLDLDDDTPRYAWIAAHLNPDAPLN